MWSSPSSSGALVLGVDEAGRGPVIGPMVVVGVVIRGRDISKLVELGVRDSKELDKENRCRIAHQILQVVQHAFIVEVPPALIDSLNINLIELLALDYIIKRTEQIYRGHIDVYVDAFTTSKKIIGLLRARHPSIRKLVFEPRADRAYPIVSAASIVAKARRDLAVEALAKLYGNFGSGYPTDPRTTEWIRSTYKLNPVPPPIVRRTWAVLRRLAPGWYVEKKVKPAAVEANALLGQMDAGRRNRSLLEFLQKESS
ncbi:MAG: ribonuclease HII [Thermoproteota archaeon]